MAELGPKINLAVYYTVICLFIGHTLSMPLYAPGSDTSKLESAFPTPQKTLSNILISFWVPPRYIYLVYTLINFCIIIVSSKYMTGLTTARRNIFLFVLTANPFSATATLDVDLSAISSNLLILSLLQVVDPFASSRQGGRSQTAANSDQTRANLPTHEVAVLRRATGYLVYLVAALLQPSLLYLASLYLLISRTQQLHCRRAGDKDASDKDDSGRRRPATYLAVLGSISSFLVYWFIDYKRRTNQMRPLCNGLRESAALKASTSIWYKYFDKLKYVVLDCTHGMLNLDWIVIAVVASLTFYYSSVRLYTRALSTSSKHSAHVAYYVNVALQSLLIVYSCSNLSLSTSTLYVVLALFCMTTNDLFFLLMSSVGLLGDVFFFSSVRYSSQYARAIDFDVLVNGFNKGIQQVGTIPTVDMSADEAANTAATIAIVNIQDSMQGILPTLPAKTPASDIAKILELQNQMKAVRPRVAMYQMTTLIIFLSIFLTYLSGIRLLTKRKHENTSRKSSVGIIVFGSIHLGMSIAGTILAHLYILLGSRGLRIALFVMELVIEPFRMAFLLVLALGSFLKCKKYLIEKVADKK